jgi:hypothetical protein
MRICGFARLPTFSGAAEELPALATAHVSAHDSMGRAALPTIRVAGCSVAGPEADSTSAAHPTRRIPTPPTASLVSILRSATDGAEQGVGRHAHPTPAFFRCAFDGDASYAA